jgi:hypothetical protein
VLRVGDSTCFELVRFQSGKGSIESTDWRYESESLGVTEIGRPFDLEEPPEVAGGFFNAKFCEALRKLAGGGPEISVSVGRSG